MTMAKLHKIDAGEFAKVKEPHWKNSDVGTIPGDWIDALIGDVFDISAGGDLDKPNFSPLLDSKYPYPIFANALTNSGLYGYSRTYRHQGDAVTITARGDVGHAVYRPEPFSAIGRLLVLRKKRKLNLRLLAEFINQRVHFSLESTGVPQLTAPQVAKYTIAFPSDEREQSAIADVLSDADALIRSLDALIAKKRDLKQAAMQQLLRGETRLPGFTEGWLHTTVGQHAVLFAGGTPSTRVAGYWGGSIPWMSSGELHQKYITQVRGRITELGLQNSPAKYVPANSVLIGLAGQGKTRGTAAISRVRLTTNQSIAAIVPNRSLNADFLFFNLDQRYEELRDLSSGDGGRGGLNLKLLGNLPISFPRSTLEQEAIASALSDMDAELRALENKRDKTIAIKQGMMQELLTGRIRLV